MKIDGIFYKEKKKNPLPKYMNWKIVFVLGNILAFIVGGGGMFLKNFLTKNIDDKYFFQIYDTIIVILIINVYIATFTISNYYYRIKNEGPKGIPGKQGKIGDRGQDVKCDVFKERVNKFKKEVIPEDLKENIKLEPVNTMSMKKPNPGWYTVFTKLYDSNNDNYIRKPELFNKVLGDSGCYKGSNLNQNECQKLSNLSPPNDKPINGAIINYNDDDGTIHALQYTFDNNFVPNKESSDTKLLSIDTMCEGIFAPFESETERQNNLDKYLVNINTSNHPIKNTFFKKRELDSMFKFLGYEGQRLKYTCKYPDFYNSYNIKHLLFEKQARTPASSTTSSPVTTQSMTFFLTRRNNSANAPLVHPSQAHRASDNYKFIGTVIRDRNNDNLFKENFYPTIICKPCKFDNNRNKFVSPCDKITNRDDCLNTGCIHGYKNIKCSHLTNENECQNMGCVYNNGKCAPPKKCHGGKIGNMNHPFSKTDDFRCPPNSAIYKIETHSTLDKPYNPGKLKGIRFYCRDIDTGEDVQVIDKYGNSNDYASFGLDKKNDNDRPEFMETEKNSITCGIHIDEDVNEKTGTQLRRPGFISDISSLYNDDGINALGFNSCVYYRNS